MIGLGSDLGASLQLSEREDFGGIHHIAFEISFKYKNPSVK